MNDLGAVLRDRDFPLRAEIVTLLRRADCHYGNALRDEEAGRGVDQAADERSVRTDRIVALRAAVHRVANGKASVSKTQAGHEDGVLRALLHFRNEMSGELQQHIDTGLARLKAEYIPDLKPIPLQCKHGRTESRPTRTASRERPCSCGLTHAGECW
ncbi:hypothetical protein V4U86_19095 [Mycobacterium sp. AMU20-3851]|uniref:hypothetical protein n=1 Tax=Mycobacterium sp. AMU20-3851 TaxID=3122055 RepID=UPI00375460FD